MNRRDHVEIDPRDVRDDTEEYEADTNAGDTVKVGVDPMSLPIVEEEIVEPAREDSSDSSGTRDGIVRSFEDMPIDLDDVSRLEADQLIASGDRARMAERIYSLRLENLKEEFCQIRKDHDETRGRLRRLESYVERRLGTDISKITRKQSKTGKHGHENQKSTKRSQGFKTEARKVKPAVKSSHSGQTKSTTKGQILKMFHLGEKYGSKTGCWLAGIGGKVGKEKKGLYNWL
ncbi:hypothetical protein Tco_1383619 [Tanacetum coccineum]